MKNNIINNLKAIKNIVLKILIVAILLNSFSCTFNVAENTNTSNALIATYNNIDNLSHDAAGYTIKWLNYDGTTLEVDNNVPHDTFPYFDGSLPVKKQNGDIHYVFVGWQPEISKVAGDITYTALFEETDREVKDGMEIGKFSSSESLLNIAIMTDPHVPYKSRYSAFGSTNVEVFKNRIENAIDKQGANTILVSGDLTAASKAEEYDLYNDTISPYKDKCDFVTGPGNHEFRFTITGPSNRRSEFKNVFAPRWRSKMKTGLYFSEWLGDTHIVALGDDYYDTDIKKGNGKKAGYSWVKGYMSSLELDWFENIVKQDDEKGITTIVLCHWPIAGTKNGSRHPKDYWAMESAEKRIKSIVSEHDNVILFSGHTHATISDAMPVQVKNGGMFVHAGAITSKVPTYVSMKQVETDKSIKKYEIKYISPTTESQTFIFSHDVPEGQKE